MHSKEISSVGGCILARALHIVEMSRFQGQGLRAITKLAQRLKFPSVRITQGGPPAHFAIPLQMHIFEGGACYRKVAKHCTWNRGKFAR